MASALLSLPTAALSTILSLVRLSSVVSPSSTITTKNPSSNASATEETTATTPPPVPENSQRPAGLRPTRLTARKHRLTEQTVEQVNDFFLRNWPFKTDKHRRRFVDEGYAFFVCVLVPESLDERIHWGCRLLTVGFLIDDLVDNMNVAEGAAFNAAVVECCRGTQLPDRDVPSQWIMYDLFEAMRAVDRRLADELLQPTIDFLLAQVDGSRRRPMNLAEYFEYRDADLGKGLISGIMRFCGGLSMTTAELDVVRPVDENVMKHITFVNDVCSYEKERLAAEAGYELGEICSSVPIVAAWLGVGEDDAKRVMWQAARGWEDRHLAMKRDILAGPLGASSALRTYLRWVEYQASGNELWSLLTPRYNRFGALGFTEGRPEAQ